MSPPSILTGDPFSLEPENCVLVVGINPGWPKLKMQKVDCEPAQEAWEAGFDEYKLHRSTFFEEAPGRLGRTSNADPRYNKGHFSRLGNTIARAVRAAENDWNPGPTARCFFREHAAILDLIPYWSRDATNLNLAAAPQQDCVRQWHRVIAAFVLEKRPRLIVVNNCGHIALINEMLSCEVSPVASSGFYAAYAGAGQLKTPVLAHPFISQWRITQRSYIDRFSEALTALDLSLPILTR